MRTKLAVWVFLFWSTLIPTSIWDSIAGWSVGIPAVLITSLLASMFGMWLFISQAEEEIC